MYAIIVVSLVLAGVLLVTCLWWGSRKEAFSNPRSGMPPQQNNRYVAKTVGLALMEARGEGFINKNLSNYLTWSCGENQGCLTKFIKAWKDKKFRAGIKNHEKYR